MIAARRSRGFSRWFAGQAKKRITRRFGRVLVHGLERARRASREAPLLFVPNHTAWWDPLVALWLAELELGLEAYAMMDARNLERLPFFGLVGAFGVDLEDARDGARAVRHAASLLDRPGRAVFVYPQGGERSAFAPLELFAGAAHVGRLAAGARVVPVGVRYVFAADEAPELWIAIGAPLAPARDPRAGVAQQRDGIAAELARIDAADLADFEVVHERRPSRLARLAEGLLAWLTRPRLAKAAAGPEAEAAAAPRERRVDERRGERREERAISGDGVAHGGERAASPLMRDRQP